MRGNTDQDPRLVRFHSLPRAVRIIYGRPRTFVSFAFGIIVFFMLPVSLRMVTRLLVGWDSFTACYLLLACAMILRNGISNIHRSAVMQDDGRFLILLVTALGAFASIAAIFSELGSAHRGTFELALATVTIALSWAMVHATFALHYAHEYYRRAKPGGLAFPGADQSGEEPDYWDFVYFSFVIGMTAQVSDVGITNKTIRRTATAHGVVSFIFNTALVALMVNIAASAI